MTGSLWRVTRRPFADLRGEGARLFGGRWSPVGTPCVYLSTTLSLAVLELLVHTDPDLLPPDLVVLRVDLVGIDHAQPDLDTLPGGWNQEIGNAATQSFGGAWLDAETEPLLVLPTVLLPIEAEPAEWNVLLNPRHPEATEVSVTQITPFSFDSRLMATKDGSR